MPTCFVIQPFDGGPFDARYEDVFCPAIKAADLEPYRVDRDPKVMVPIDSIEQGIRSAAACLADITTDNPNVWYELGYAFASGTPTVMVCSADRQGKKYPFDIQHRTVISYSTGSPRDFEKLKNEIAERLKAFMGKAEVLQRIEESRQVAPVGGLGPMELAVLAAAAGSVLNPDEVVSVHSVKRDVEQFGFTPLAFALGLRPLLSKALLEEKQEYDDRAAEPYKVVKVTEKGWAWIDKNESQFVLQRPKDESGIPF